MINIEIKSSVKQTINPDMLEQAARATLILKYTSTDASLTVVLSNDSHLQELNREYRGIDTPTDVLSFPAFETDPETGSTYLGDVIISVPRAEAQAAEAGHSVVAELKLLVVHGVLHLLGYDHLKEDEKSRMWAAQTEILEQIGATGVEDNL